MCPKLFLCKSDQFGSAPASTTDTSATPNWYNDFQSDYQYSYGFAYPWASATTVGEWWKNTTNASLPLIADMGPLKGSAANPVSDTSTTIAGGSKAWNSPNHQLDGENVGFADVHVDYSKRPDVGMASDNIYTIGLPTTPRPPVRQSPPLFRRRPGHGLHFAPDLGAV